MQRPADLYEPSAKRYRSSDKTIKYPEDYLVKQVSQSGFITYSGEHYFLGEAFAGVNVGLHKNLSHQTEIFFANKCLGVLTTELHGLFRPPSVLLPTLSQRTQTSN